MRIAYVMQNTGVDIASDAGASILVKYTINGLQQAGHQLHLLALKDSQVVSLNDTSEPENYTASPLGITGNPIFLMLEGGVRRIQRAVRLPYFAFFDSLRFYDACLRALTDYDLCHEYAGLLSVGAALACKKLNKPYVLTVDADLILERKVAGSPLCGLQALAARQAAKISYKLADKIICVSAPAKENLINAWQTPPDKIHVIPNGVDVERFGKNMNSDAIREKFHLSDAPVVLFLGSFQFWHGLDLLVESFSRILEKIPNAKLLLVGDGPARAMVEQKIVEIGLANSILLTGAIPHRQIPEILAAADVVTIPYPQLPQELWFSPLKLFEYMAAGKAIVASKAGQIADVITHEQNGLLVEPGDVNALAQAVIELLEDSGKRMELGRNARQQAVSTHSWKQHIACLEDVYRSVL
ncbi:MAG: glycosyltransferase family 4 protein [Chloroflexi bacterium]|nr:glycosyltransferase family 4 protein [Chloroflexota bacterium]